MSGKWDDPSVPKKNWTCNNVEDLGDLIAVCEMCEVQEIRYVHSMEHPDYPDILEVGCICAGHMEEDYAAARRRETNLKNMARRRSKWLARAGWRTSQKGNDYINAVGFNVVVFGNENAWLMRIKDIDSDEKPFFSRESFETKERSKLAAFDKIVEARRNRRAARKSYDEDDLFWASVSLR
jgi:hypothetical protein